MGFFWGGWRGGISVFTLNHDAHQPPFFILKCMFTFSCLSSTLFRVHCLSVIKMYFKGWVGLSLVSVKVQSEVYQQLKWSNKHSQKQPRVTFYLHPLKFISKLLFPLLQASSGVPQQWRPHLFYYWRRSLQINRQWCLDFWACVGNIH